MGIIQLFFHGSQGLFVFFLFFFKLLECCRNLSLKHFFFFFRQLFVAIRSLDFKFKVFDGVLVPLSLSFKLLLCCLEIVILLLFKFCLHFAYQFILLRLYFLYLIDKFLLKIFVLISFFCDSFFKG